MSKARIVFVHGLDGYGAAAWPAQHLLAGDFDCLFLKRTGFDAVAEPVSADPDADARIVIEALDSGGHVVAHGQGAVAAVMAAVLRPDLVHSLILIEPLLLSLTADLPATSAFSKRLEDLAGRGVELPDHEFLAEFNTLVGLSPVATVESGTRRAARARLQSAAAATPLAIVPGVPTTVVTGGWEPLYEEVADYLESTGARHVVLRSGPRPQDTSDGASLVEGLIETAETARLGQQARGDVSPSQ